MKKFYLLALTISFSFGSFAQQRSVEGSTKVKQSGIKSQSKVLIPTDTLFWTSGTATYYNSTGGGYVAGRNGYGDLAKHQKFVVTTPYNVEGAVVWFCAKEAGGSTGDTASKVRCNIYNMDGTGESTAGASVPAPGTIVTGVDILWDDIDTNATGANGMVYVTFAAPFSATVDFAVGVDFSTLSAGDTTGLFSTTDGDAGGAELSWEEWSDNTLHTLLKAWPLDIDLGIFPIIDNSVGISEMSFINGIKLYQNYPNPFAGQSVINYELDKNAKDVKVFVFDAKGKFVKKMELGAQTAGAHLIELNSSDFSSGTYTFAIQADSHRLAKRMTVIK